MMQENEITVHSNARQVNDIKQVQNLNIKSSVVHTNMRSHMHEHYKQILWCV